MLARYYLRCTIFQGLITLQGRIFPLLKSQWKWESTAVWRSNGKQLSRFTFPLRIWEKELFHENRFASTSKIKWELFRWYIIWYDIAKYAMKAWKLTNSMSGETFTKSTLAGRGEVLKYFYGPAEHKFKCVRRQCHMKLVHLSVFFLFSKMFSTS